MEPNKFEKQIKKELRGREIQPQKASWEKLNSRLEKEDKKSTSVFYFIGIAASITAAIIVFSFTFNAPQVSDSPAVVNRPIDKIEEKEQKQVQSTIDQIAEQVPEVKKESSEEKSTIAEQSKEVPVLKSRPDLATVQPKSTAGENLEEISSVTPQENEEEVITPNLQELIAEVSSKAMEGNLEESEVDALLYKAAAEISLNRNKNSLTGKVDAQALLEDVEMELDQNFREKVFDIMKEGYLKARTAVANRNF